MYNFTDTDESSSIVYVNSKGEEIFLANFTAKITEETRYVDGKAHTTTFKITGRSRGKNLPEVDVAADKFPSLAWVLPAWGVAPVISPVPNAERLLRAAIQQHSRPKIKTIY